MQKRVLTANGQGFVVTNQDQIKNMVVDFYKQLLGEATISKASQQEVFAQCLILL